MGIEETELAANMVITVEPHIGAEELFLGLEDMVLVTETGGESLTQFPWVPFEL
jgi:Xaa-Pro aminopeptidase